ncbi:bifunctional serine/threonine-protein kinase/formylglycine-generating enzyme family protein [Laspinema sp. A4]|uniref:bifunctional serine/threonine-protein kinase/formylglycine-generating enzyme family protein n=1 Tax=Laspinema sp. D2d TaxID=2953686 RepID=UPI0021BAE4E4|nr:bifunctional serine/threonine-protein kinase/formylglycine-generating enzyme family protein [Laspinema sp. D2d]MCT7983499.1 bifunctional serine/threonine-protein kinase/formylglycine-generating enzyme family protein [Laspinema sp. D2d]
MVWQPGTKIFGDRYTIEKPLKVGGFGITYLVKDRQGQQFVLKTLKDELMTETQYIPYRDKFMRDFDRETARIAICRHRHIVQVENLFTHEGLPCMVMEYIQGQDLSDRVRGGALPEAVALRYIRQVGEALSVMHDKGWLHRDIKPQNIMVRLPEDEAVLIDFGIAREFIPNLTQIHTTFLTHHFAPIEQYEEEEHRGEFTDVYALAATLYYLLTATLPPIATKRLRQDRLAIPSHWSPELQNAIKQGMAVEPEDRPQTVAAWLGLLPNGGGGLPSFSFETVRVNRQGKIIEKIPGQARFYPQDLGQGVQLDMVQIPGGTFLMGTEEAEIERLCKKYDDEWFKEWLRRESPQHSVQVSSFFMGKTPVTQDQWRTVVTQVGTIVRDLDPDPSNFKGGNRPVDWVSWSDAVEWCARLSKLTGKEYRLPSEAEWEYACRAGTTTPFAFGEAITTDLANYNGNYTVAEEAKGQYREETTPVASFPPNSFGLYDLHGNVWEWCFDPFHENYQGAPRDGSVWDETIKENENRYQNPSANLKVLLAESDKTYVLRGGSWLINSLFCRSAFRDDNARGYFYDNLGFRVCLVGAGLL